MEVEQKDDSDNGLANGNTNPGKRGRGRPRGSVKKNIISVKEVSHNARPSKKVDFFSPEMVLKPKVKKRGRPKKIRIPGRPRKIPLTPEEEAERLVKLSKQRKRKLSKPLGRPRIHPLVDMPKKKRGRGRPRKYESVARASSQNGAADPKSLKIAELGEASPRRRGRPPGSFKKKRGRPSGSGQTKRPVDGTPKKRGRPPSSATNPEENGLPRKRGRPPGSGKKLKVLSREGDETPKKRGRPPGSGTKVKPAKLETDGIPKKRGRPPGSGTKVKVVRQETDGTPRKRGRPPGSGKTKTTVKETEDADHSSSSALSVSGTPRKRGRPSKASLAEASEEVKNKVNDASSPKRPRNSLEESETEADVEDQKTSENDACHVATMDAPVNMEGVCESSLKVAGKSPKKK